MDHQNVPDEGEAQERTLVLDDNGDVIIRVNVCALQPNCLV